MSIHKGERIRQTFRIPTSLMRRVEVIATQRRISVNELVNEWLEREAKRQDEKSTERT